VLLRHVLQCVAIPLDGREQEVAVAPELLRGVLQSVPVVLDCGEDEVAIPAEFRR